MNSTKKTRALYEDDPDLHLQHLYMFRRDVNEKYTGDVLKELNDKINEKMEEVKAKIEKNERYRG